MSRTLMLAGAAVVVSATTLALTAPASANPADRMTFKDAQTFEFPLCGIPTLVELAETGTVMTVRKGRDREISVRVHLHGEVTNTNLATGRSVRLVQDAVTNDVRIVRDGDLLTITSKTMFHERDYNADGSLAFFTTGQQSVELVVDTLGTEGLEDDEVVSEEFADFHGRNDRADLDFCEWYAGQTG